MIQKIGFVGLGAMGLGMARNLLEGGFEVHGCDLREEARQALREVGGSATDSIETLLEPKPDVLALCLAGEAVTQICENVLLPRAPAGLRIMDHSTIPAPETRRLHAAFAEKGIDYFDVPISGGRGGAESGQLYLFIGGTAEHRADFTAYFDAVANPETVFYAGQVGQGQVMKAVQNMASWYMNAARQEILAFARHSGLSDAHILQSVKEDREPGDFARLLRQINADNVGIQVNLNAEYAYFLKEADANGFPMPLMRGLMDFLETEPRDAIDVVNRPAHNTWQRFMRTCEATPKS
ncbi:MAG: NAD(P)-dependent oxidoreductase [Opitutales bacterium]